MLNFRIILLVAMILPGAFACQSTVRKAMYSAYETIGTEKRDLLKSRVKKARDAQEESSEEFKDALTHLKELYGFDGGNLEKAYNEVSDDYDSVKKSADDVRTSIERMDQVAKDLFDEWEKEIKQMTTPSYQTESRRQLRETRDRYSAMHSALARAEKTMQPALARLRDQVLFLKHNLNARAVDSLKKKGEGLQTDIDRVIREVNASIEKADRFIQEMSVEGPKG